MNATTYNLDDERRYFQSEINRKGAARVAKFTRRNLDMIPEAVHAMIVREFPELGIPTVEEYEQWIEDNC